MNIERLTHLAEVLEAAGENHRFNGTDRHGHPLFFSMYTWESRLHAEAIINRYPITESDKLVFEEHRCGTVCCIAGYTQIMANNGIRPAHDLLGLDELTAGKLFYPHTIKGEYEHERDHPWKQITPAQAAKVIRHLIATGDVDWSIIQ